MMIKDHTWFIIGGVLLKKMGNRHLFFSMEK